ncbi:MAG: ABC transporter permease [Dehalococcoidia bacterium]|nr:ABC transporter permease [Dehalococcoidia bacterium]MSQ16430.1 ABC transporter permease [Dehalococcoidia bacterium]
MLALTLANLRMMSRNYHSTFWALFFPLLLVAVFGLFDVGSGPGAFSLAVVDQDNSPRSRQLVEQLAKVESLELEEQAYSLDTARRRVARGDLDYLLVIAPGFGAASQAGSAPLLTLAYDSAKGRQHEMVEALVRDHAGQSASPAGVAAPTLASQGLTVTKPSYFDVVLLGLVGFGTMTHSIISIAVRITANRNLSIYKRLLVTPLPVWKYFAAEISSHLMLAITQAAMILGVGVWVFGAHLPGNLLATLAVVALGSLVFLNIGFIISAWTNTPAAASGMGNAVALPMVFFGGAFFSTASLPWLLPQLAQALPLTPMLSAMNLVALQNAPLWQAWPQLAVLGAWVGTTSLVAIKVFRFS